MRTTILSLAAVALLAAPAFAQQWGNIKGKVVWAEDKIPEAPKVNVDKDQNHCLAKGALLKDELVIDPQSKGVKNVMVWLVAKEGGKIDINPKLAAVPQEKVTIDQPMCLFEPRVTMMRAGQTLVVKNSAPVTHNTRITGNNDINGTINLTIPPSGTIEKTLKAEKRPLQLACDIHGWMGGRIAVFDHPYFALTDKDGNFEIKDAPAGDFLIFINHEKAGWLHTPRTSKGQPISIPAGGTLDLGKIEMKAEYLK
jgi:hypothetical protein